MMDKSRQQFEDYCRSVNSPLEIFNGDYNWNSTRVAWGAWQASRERLDIELPEHPDKSDPFYGDFDLGMSLGIDKVKEVLIANGVKVK